MDGMAYFGGWFWALQLAFSLLIGCRKGCTSTIKENFSGLSKELFLVSTFSRYLSLSLTVSFTLRIYARQKISEVWSNILGIQMS